MIAKVRIFFQSAMGKVEKLRAMVLFSFKMQSFGTKNEIKRRAELFNLTCRVAQLNVPSCST